MTENWRVCSGGKGFGTSTQLQGEMAWGIIHLHAKWFVPSQLRVSYGVQRLSSAVKWLGVETQFRVKLLVQPTEPCTKLVYKAQWYSLSCAVKWLGVETQFRVKLLEQPQFCCEMACPRDSVPVGGD